MKPRNISLTIEQARELYKSDNTTLKYLALTAFTEEELKLDSYDWIMKEISNSTTRNFFCYPIVDHETVRALNKLRNIAFYLNRGWRVTTIDTGYYLFPSSQANCSDQYKKYGWCILKHVTTKCPGIIYFKSEDIALKALDIAHAEGWLDDLK